MKTRINVTLDKDVIAEFNRVKAPHVTMVGFLAECMRVCVEENRVNGVSVEKIMRRLQRHNSEQPARVK